MFNVECNGVLVVEFDTSECESYWELQIKQFAFESRDDASEYYRIVSQGKKNDVLNLFVCWPPKFKVLGTRGSGW